MEENLRVAVFCSGFALFAVLEHLMPWRGIEHRGARWLKHFLVIGFGTVCVRFLLASGALGASLWAEELGVGLMHWLEIPVWMEVGLSFIALDCLIYWQHRLFHWLPWCWWFHRYHHRDVQLDVSSALRFHPVEIVASMGIKMLSVVALGAPLLAVFIFEVTLNFVSMFNHCDWKLPRRLEQAIRYVIVTPDMHRIHHSAQSDDMLHNFGFNFSFWDRVFGSYRPVHSGERIRFGVFDRKK